MAKRQIPTGIVWVRQIFTADQVAAGGIVRRRVRDVQRLSSRALLEREVKRRGFHLPRTGNQYVVICNQGDFRVFC